MRLISVLALGVMAVGALQRSAPDLNARIAAEIAKLTPGLIDIRRDIHRHPELSGEESRTANLIAAHLRAAGLEVRTGVGGYGVVGRLTGGKAGPLVAYRADMDAVTSAAPDPVEFKSVVPGVRHICGHDIHVTIGLGLASALSRVRADLPGRVMFIFQPAEERATGARAMLDAGVFAPQPPAAIFGLHSSPSDAGRISSTAGLMMYPNPIAPGVTNDAALFAAARADLVAAVGADAYSAVREPPAGFSEDFGAFQARVPGVFFFLGVGNAARGLDAMPHSPNFVADEAAIPFGIKAMAAVVVGRLRAQH